MNITASNRMEIFSPAIFGELNEKATIKQKEGTPIVDLSLGSPDLPPSKIIRDTLAKSSAKENMYGYTLGGTQRFHQAVANYYKRTMNVEIDAETEVLQTMGSQEGLVHL
ncbi:MAG TPA: LL-diaminopimelate aminotransferase, partial [Pseudogracilibacillus sp.]|nr:LL-diaminopimelate aminotransferase [Pseudogracilibacillus sp.]